MKTNIGKNRIITLLIALILCFVSISINGSETAYAAASKYITVGEFIKSLVTELKLPVVNEGDDPYISTAMAAGILKAGDFTMYTSYITRTDAAVLLNRADEFLNGDNADPDLLQLILEERISDIKKIPAEKREAVAKIYAKGIIKGYSNGYYIKSREFRGSKYLTKDGAKNTINLVTNPEERAKLSPDGLLIRTTNLPKNAKDYEYILECYPNKFYEKKFEYMFTEQYKAGQRNPEYEIKPVDIRNSTFKTWNEKWSFSIEMDKYLYDWADKAETYLNYLFNVDYRNVDDKWIEGLASCYVKSNIDEAESIRNYYIKHMKENKVIVESSIIAVEPSILYYDGSYRMRAYVKYRITAKNINVKQNRLLWCQYPALDNLKSGVWRDGIFDIRFGTNNGFQGDGSYWAIEDLDMFIDEHNVPIG